MEAEPRPSAECQVLLLDQLDAEAEPLALPPVGLTRQSELPSDFPKTFSATRRKATAEGRTLTSLIEDGLRLIVTENKKGTKGKHVLPRISKATGGPLPGIELTDLSTLREIDDLDYIRRMHRPGPPPTKPRGRTALSEVSR